MASRDRWPFFAFAALVLGYVLLRAAVVPIVNDEARAFYMYVFSGNFLPFLAPWDAANHPLLTALAQLSWKLGGTHPFALRIWSVLAFILYAWYAWRMGQWLRSRLVRWCCWAALLGAPFLLDFFALFRGYALGVGFLLMMLFHLVRLLREQRRADLISALAASALAGFAMLSLLIVWYAAFALLAWVVLRGRQAGVRKDRVAWCLALGSAPLLIATVFLWGLKTRGQLYSGTDGGFFHGTVRSLVMFVGGFGSQVWLILLCLPIAAAMLYSLYPPTGRRGSQRDELARLAALLLAAEIIGREFLFLTTDALFPIDRGALHLVPLSIVLVACVIDRLAERTSGLAFASLPLLLLPLRSITLVNLDSTLIWGSNSIPGHFYQLVEKRQQALGRPLILGGHDGIKEAWSFGQASRHHGEVALDPIGFPQPHCDLLLIDTAHFDPPSGFRSIASTSTGENLLMERIRPLRLHEVLDTVVERNSTMEAYVVLWRPDAGKWAGRQALVEVDARFTGLPQPSGVTLVADASDTTNLLYRNIFVDRYRTEDDQHIHLSIRLPDLPSSTRSASIYLFNPEERSFGLSASVKVREILPDAAPIEPDGERPTPMAP